MLDRDKTTLPMILCYQSENQNKQITAKNYLVPIHFHEALTVLCAKKTKIN